jgi:hypothetical protein
MSKSKISAIKKATKRNNAGQPHSAVACIADGTSVVVLHRIGEDEDGDREGKRRARLEARKIGQCNTYIGPTQETYSLGSTILMQIVCASC